MKKGGRKRKLLWINAKYFDDEYNSILEFCYAPLQFQDDIRDYPPTSEQTSGSIENEEWTGLLHLKI